MCVGVDGIFFCFVCLHRSPKKSTTHAGLRILIPELSQLVINLTNLCILPSLSAHLLRSLEDLSFVLDRTTTLSVSQLNSYSKIMDYILDKLKKKDLKCCWTLSLFSTMLMTEYVFLVPTQQLLRHVMISIDVWEVGARLKIWKLYSKCAATLERRAFKVSYPLTHTSMP